MLHRCIICSIIKLACSVTASCCISDRQPHSNVSTEPTHSFPFLQVEASAAAMRQQAAALQRAEASQIQFYQSSVVRQLEKELDAWTLRDEIEPPMERERRRDYEAKQALRQGLRERKELAERPAGDRSQQRQRLFDESS